MKVNRNATRLLLAAAAVIPVPVYAYVGPGAGLGAIGTVIALLGAILLGIVGFVWYPIKRLLNRSKQDDAVEDETSKKGLDSELAESKPEK
jgi:hypothetical protein